MKFVAICMISMLSMYACSSTQGNKTNKNTDTVVLISTNKGDIKVKLYNDTPKHKENFIKIVNDGTLEGTLFHRVIKGFMVQGGDPNSKNAGPNDRLGSGSLGYRVDAEFNPKYIHKKGALAAARDNNPAKASSACQFYLVQGKPQTDVELNGIESSKGFKYTPEQREIYKTIGGAAFLDQGYTVFGEVIEGLEIVDKICAVETAPGDRPLEDIKMSVKILD